MPVPMLLSSRTFPIEMVAAGQHVKFAARRIAASWSTLRFRKSVLVLGFGARRRLARRFSARIGARTLYMFKLTIFSCAAAFKPKLSAPIARHTFQTTLRLLSDILLNSLHTKISICRISGSVRCVGRAHDSGSRTSWNNSFIAGIFVHHVDLVASISCVQGRRD